MRTALDIEHIKICADLPSAALFLLNDLEDAQDFEIRLHSSWKDKKVRRDAILQARKLEQCFNKKKTRLQELCASIVKNSMFYVDADRWMCAVSILLWELQGDAVSSI